MQSCKCGTLVPFEPCPTCPAIEWICPTCGAEVIAEPIPLKEYADVIKRFKARHKQVDP